MPCSYIAEGAAATENPDLWPYPIGTFIPVTPGLCPALALLFGLFNLIAGIWLVVQGIELRRTGKTLDSAFPEKQPA
jgi:hypothetical protein